ncbi:MAG: AMP-binding protein, partial [Desulfobacterales bacterium]|nr:AMP-binding protein [Desulfobacterales bacterium]
MEQTSKQKELSLETVREQILGKLPEPVAFDEDTDLITLGLDSMKIMSLVNIWRRAGKPVTFARLMEKTTLCAWWKLLSAAQNHTSKGKRSPSTIPETPSPAPDSPFALTDVQHAYWIGRRDDQPLGGVGCHAYLELDGADVDPHRLESAWQGLCRCHPMLRARFLDSGEQVVMPRARAFSLPVHDLRQYRTDSINIELTRIRKRLSHRRLAVETGEVAGLELSLLPGNRTRIHFDVDLLVADVKSMQTLLKDLGEIYERGNLPHIKEWSFGRYLATQHLAQAGEVEIARDYWQHRLPELPGGPALPLAVRPETLNRPVFKRRTHTLSPESWARIQKRARAAGITPAMVLLTAYADILDRWSSSSKFLINIPLFDRDTAQAGINSVVADFTNLLLLAVDYSTPASFLDRAGEIQSRFRKDAAHAAYSGVRVLRDMSRQNPEAERTAPVVFACNLGIPLIHETCRRNLGNLTHMISQTPQVWLDFQIYETEEGLLLAWDAVDALFPKGMVDRMFMAMTQFMDWLARKDGADETAWNSIPLNLPEIQQQVDERSRPDNWPAPKSSCLHTPFFRQAAATPDAPAIIWNDQEISYAQLASSALKAAAFLKSAGVDHGDTIAVSLPRGPLQISAVLGVLAVGCAYVPVAPDQPRTRRDRILQKADITFVLTDGKRSAEDWPQGIQALNASHADSETPLGAPLPVQPDQTAYIIFTSGSTGLPKGVEIRHESAWNTVADINQRLGISTDDRVLAVSSLEFDLSVYD